MTLASSDLETDLFYAEAGYVYRRGVIEASDITNQPTGASTEPLTIGYCGDFHDLDTAQQFAEQIARALNRLPKAEAILVDLVGAIRETADLVGQHQGSTALTERADAVEEWMING